MVTKDTIQHRARKIKIRTEPKLDIAAEGIMLGTGKAMIKALPQALHVIAPDPDVAGAEKPKEETAQELPAPVSIVAGANVESD